MPAFEDIQEALDFFLTYSIEFHDGQILWAGGQKYTYNQGKWELLEDDNVISG